MLIKEYLEKSKSHLLYPESYSSKQIKATEKILEFFREISLGINDEQPLEVRLENNSNTIIVMPLKKSYVIGITNIPDTHKTKWGDNGDSLIIKPKRKFRKQFPQILIIRRTYKASS